MKFFNLSHNLFRPILVIGTFSSLLTLSNQALASPEICEFIFGVSNPIVIKKNLADNLEGVNKILAEHAGLSLVKDDSSRNYFLAKKDSTQERNFLHSQQDLVELGFPLKSHLGTIEIFGFSDGVGDLLHPMRFSPRYLRVGADIYQISHRPAGAQVYRLPSAEAKVQFRSYQSGKYWHNSFLFIENKSNSLSDLFKRGQLYTVHNLSYGKTLGKVRLTNDQLNDRKFVETAQFASSGDPENSLTVMTHIKKETPGNIEFLLFDASGKKILGETLTNRTRGSSQVFGFDESGNYLYIYLPSRTNPLYAVMSVFDAHTGKFVGDFSQERLLHSATEAPKVDKDNLLAYGLLWEGLKMTVENVEAKDVSDTIFTLQAPQGKIRVSIPRLFFMSEDRGRRIFNTFP